MTGGHWQRSTHPPLVAAVLSTPSLALGERKGIHPDRRQLIYSLRSRDSLNTCLLDWFLLFPALTGIIPLNLLNNF